MQLHHQLWIDFVHLLRGLRDEQYTAQCQLLSGATIGEHLRHSFEFYQCLLKGIPQGRVNYDNRRREPRFQNDRTFSLNKIEALLHSFEKIPRGGSLQMISKEADTGVVHSSIERELVYCLDHAIHHQALIKIALRELGSSSLVSDDFGVAYSTLRFRKESV